MDHPTAPPGPAPDTAGATLRGERAIAELLSLLGAALADGSFVKLALSRGRAADLPQASARLVDVKGQPHLSLTLRHATRDVVANHPLDRAATVVGELLAERFDGAHLFTTAADHELRRNRRGEAMLFRGKPTFQAPPERRHDRERDYLLDPGDARFLIELGLVGREGRVRAEQADKYRQIQHLLKIVDELAGKAGLAARPRLRVVDLGAGKGYLTFALHHHFQRTLGLPVEVLGVDRNRELVDLCNGVAARLELQGLRFETGEVASAPLGEVDVLVALHACDTATDDALARGVEAGAALLLAAPCCHQEVRPQLVVPPEELPLLRHDTFKDRFTQMLTDGVRALLLESRGYRTRVSEFISDAHTQRNVLLAGVLDPASGLRQDWLDEARALCARYGVRRQRLAERLSRSAKAPAID